MVPGVKFTRASYGRSQGWKRFLSDGDSTDPFFAVGFSERSREFLPDMNYLDLTLPTPAENLACDEFLLEQSDEQESPSTLRLWESPSYFVVLGYANKVGDEVNRALCEDRGIPILRRCSGGGTVVQGCGCLNYSLILNLAEHPDCQTITQTNRYVMERHRELLEMHLGARVEIQGHTDLAIHTDNRVRKFSGNAQRRKRNAVLFHGTFLLDFDLWLISQILKMPPVQPSYRENRPHEEFVENLNRPAAEIKRILQEGWNAIEDAKIVRNLPDSVVEKYRGPEWNFKF